MGFQIADIFATIRAEDAGYHRSMSAVKTVTAGTAAHVDLLAHKVKHLFGFLAAGIGFHAVVEMEKNVRLLKAAIEAAGESAAESFPKLDQLANKMVQMTGISRNAYLEAMKMSFGWGSNTEEMEALMQAASGLTVIMNTDLETALRALESGQHGNFRWLQFRIRDMQKLASAEDRWALTLEKAAQGLKILQDAGSRVDTTIEMLASALTELGRSILQPVLEPIAKLVRSIAGLTQGFGEWAKAHAEIIDVIVTTLTATVAFAAAIRTVGYSIKFVVGAFAMLSGSTLGLISAIAALIGMIVYALIPGDELGQKMDWIGQKMNGLIQWAKPAWNTFLTGLAFALAAIENGFVHFGAYVELAITGVALGAVKLASQIGYFFGTYIPYVLSYLTRNWKDIFQTMENYLAAFFTNLSDNIWNFGAELIKQLKSGFTADWNYHWKSLATGAQSAMQEAFKPPDREAGALEKWLSSEAQRLSLTLNTDFVSRAKDIMASFGLDKPIQAFLGTAVDPKKPHKLEFKGHKKDDEDKGSPFMAIDEGWKKLQEAAFRTQQDIAQEHLDESKKQTGILHSIGEALKNQHPNPVTS